MISNRVKDISIILRVKCKTVILKTNLFLQSILISFKKRTRSHIFRKSYKICFANEPAYTRTVSEIFYMIDEAYKALSNINQKKFYDKGMGVF